MSELVYTYNTNFVPSLGMNACIGGVPGFDFGVPGDPWGGMIAQGFGVVKVEREDDVVGASDFMVFSSARNALFESPDAASSTSGFIYPEGFYNVQPSNVPYDVDNPDSLGKIHLRWNDRAVVATLDGSAGLKGEDEMSLTSEMGEDQLRQNRRLWGNWDGVVEFSFP
jgi:hypothetical protein